MKRNMSTTFACISDLHMLHNMVAVPDADVLACAGDLSVGGTIEEMREAMTWLSRLPHRVKLFVPGNHDSPLQDPALLAMFRAEFPGITILIDETIVANGLKIHGTPWVSGPWAEPDHMWSFDIWSVEGRMAKWNMIPDDVDVLITHTPAGGVLDQDSDGLSRGCIALEHRISKLHNVKLHVFGHIHPSAGMEVRDGIIRVNAGIAMSRCSVREPFVIELAGAA